MAGIKTVARPQHTPRHQVEVTIIADRFIEVPQRGAEDPGSSITIDPSDREIIVTLGSALEHGGRGEDLHVVVEFLVARDPIPPVQPLGDRMAGIDRADADRLGFPCFIDRSPRYSCHNSPGAAR